VARFRREAWTSAQIDSPNVVRVMDVDVLPDGSPYLVMELLVGRDLETELGDRGRLPVREAVDYALQAAAGIAQAHARGVIHRDLKPNNLFLCDEPSGRRVKVLDFGLSKVTAELSVTATHASLGTPLYMSPEQIRSPKHVDTRTDVWSLAVILYRALAGHTPFHAPTPAELLVAIMSEPPLDLQRAAPGVPAELSRAVMKALRKDHHARFASVGEFAGAIAVFGRPGAFFGAASSGAPAVPAHYADQRRPTEHRDPGSTFLDSSQDTPSEPRSSRGWTVGLVVAGMTLATALGLGLGARWFAPGQQRPDDSIGAPGHAARLAPPVSTAAPQASAPVPAASSPPATTATATVSTEAPAKPRPSPVRRQRAPRARPTNGEPNLGF
jgi:serine/threonine-protein kinase